MSLVRILTLSTRYSLLPKSSSLPQLGFARAAHTININLNVGQDASKLEIHGLETGNIVINQLSNACQIEKIPASRGVSFEKDLLALTNAQLQRLLIEKYQLVELSDCMKKHNLTGANLVYGVESVLDLKELGINTVQARTLFQLISVWKTEGLTEFDLAVHDRTEIFAQTSVPEPEPDFTSKLHQKNDDVHQQLNKYFTNIGIENARNDGQASVSAAEVSEELEQKEEEQDQDAELMEWYAQLDIAFINARWGGQPQQAQLIQLAAQSGEDPLADAYLSILLEKGCPVIWQDRSKALFHARRALPWLLQESVRGNPYAQYNLGFCYTDGRGVPYDAEKAAQLYELAAKQGHEGARVNLGIAYERGEGVQQDFAMAVAYYKGAYSHPHALKSYGHCFAHAKGVDHVPELARFFYKQAADKGHMEAQYLVAKCFMDGHGTEPDLQEAKKYFKMAAAQGHREAMNVLGMPLDHLPESS